MTRAGGHANVSPSQHDRIRPVASGRDRDRRDGQPGPSGRRRRPRRPDPGGRRPRRRSVPTRSRPCSTSAGRVVAPGFIDPHGHSDGSLFVDGALASHLHQGYTTQLAGNCGDTLAPITDIGREIVELSLRPHGLVARWRTFGEYLDRVAEQPLGPNVAFLVGHGTRPRRRSSAPRHARRPTTSWLRWSRRSRRRSMPGRSGCRRASSTRPGCMPTPDEIEALVAATARRGGLYATHMRNESDGLFDSLDESIATVRAGGSGGQAPGLAPQVRLERGLGPGRRGGRPPGGGPRRGSRRRRRPVPVHGRRDDPRDDPAAGAPGPRRRRSASRRSPTRTSATSSAARSGAASRAGRTWPSIPAGPGSGSRTPPATRTGPAVRWRSSADETARRPVRPRLRCAGRRPARRLGRDRLHERAGRRDDHGRALDRRLHRRRGPSPGSPDPRCRPAPPADVRQHGPRPRHVRARAGHAGARDGRRQAQLGPGRAARPARSRDRSGGRPRRPRRLRPRDGRRRGDLRPTRPATRPASSTSSSTGGRRSSTAPRPGERPGRLLRRS